MEAATNFPLGRGGASGLGEEGVQGDSPSGISRTEVKGRAGEGCVFGIEGVGIEERPGVGVGVPSSIREYMFRTGP